MVRVAVVGCCHGELDKIYRDIAARDAADGRRSSLLLIGGDFQACRDAGDLQCMAVPAKYRRLGDFQAYYAGRRRAPLPTVFVGGNHEASNFMQELPHGGYVAQDIYYLGHAGVLRFGGLRIAGISGIYDRRDLTKGRSERPPYDEGSLRSVYHTRQFDVERLSLYTKHRLDIVMSHDWPRNVYRHGDTRALLRQKPYFRKEVERGELGSPANEQLLHALKPRHWFSAHLHVKFEATIRHGQPATGQGKKRRRSDQRDEPRTSVKIDNPEEIELELSSSDDGSNDEAPTGDAKSREQEDAAAAAALEAYRAQALARLQETSFLALDKCLPNRKYLDFMDIEPEDATDTAAEHKLEYDADWLAIVRAMDQYASTERYQKRLPSKAELEEQVATARQWIDEHVTDLGALPPFERSAPTDPDEVRLCPNSQTSSFRKMLGLA